MEEKSYKEHNNIKSILNVIAITVGCAIMAIGLHCFCIGNKIAPGGFSGLSTVLHYLFNVPVGMTSFALCVPFFIIMWKKNGFRAVVSTIYGTAVLSLFIDALSLLPVFTEDIFLASIFGGIILGLGLGIVFKFGGNTGGTDLIAVLIKDKNTNISIGTWLLIIDGIVVVTAGIAFRDFEIMLYSIITMYVTIKMVDVIVEGFNYAKAFYIFTEKPDEMKKRIYSDLSRGVTYIKAQGGYNEDNKNILLCVVMRSQVMGLKRIVQEVDKNSFVILTDVHEVLGEGFAE